MRHLLPVLIIFSFFACNKKDAPPPAVGTVTSLSLNGVAASGKPRIVFGQYVKVAVGLSDSSNIKQYGFSISPDQSILSKANQSMAFVPEFKNKESLIKFFATDAFDRSIETEVKITPEKADFRGAYWGQVIDDIKLTETHHQSELLNQTNTVVLYRAKGSVDNGWPDDKTVAGDMIGYLINNGKLEQGAILFDRNYTLANPNQCLVDFLNIGETRLAGYGTATPTIEPLDDSQEALDYLEDEEKWGEGVLKGYLVLYATAQTSRTDIIMILMVEDGELNFGIYYEPRDI